LVLLFRAIILIAIYSSKNSLTLNIISSVYFLGCWKIHLIQGNLDWKWTAIVKTLCEIAHLLFYFLKGDNKKDPEGQVISFIFMFWLGHFIYIAHSYYVDK
jgi:hypothetical protein